MILTKDIYINNLIAIEGRSDGLSFNPFYKELLERQKDNSLGGGISRMVADRIQEMERLNGNWSIENVEKFLEAYELIFGWVNDLTESESIAWGMSTPIPSLLFAATDTMYDLLDQPITPVKKAQFKFICQDSMLFNGALYELILDRLYGIPMLNRVSYVYECIREDSVKKYIEMQLDFTFVTVAARGQLPKIDFSCVNKPGSFEKQDVKTLLSGLHIDDFQFEGFSMLRFVDVTERHAVASIQDIMSNLSQYTQTGFLNDISERVQSVAGLCNLKSSLFPILYLNGIPILKDGVNRNNLLFRDYVNSKTDAIGDEILQYLEAPFVLSHGVHPDFDTPYFKSKIAKLNVNSYVSFPLKYQEKLVGFLELYTQEGEKILPSVLGRISSLFPVLTQLAYNLREEFKNRLETVILENYTALQPAVQWRFNQAAAQYLSGKNGDKKVMLLEDISFKDVYPLYGGIDIKDSTLLRNLAFRKDNVYHLRHLKELMTFVPAKKFPDVAALKSFTRKIAKVEGWLSTDRMVDYMQEITSFFQEEVPTFILTFSWIDSELDKQVKVYAETLGKTSYQDDFESSLQQVNTVIAKELSLFNNFVQHAFPSYFEKFRTDGIEYDFYVGQSISPTVSFDNSILRLFRRQQFISMARICMAVNDIRDSLPIALSTTQLIFVHPKPIDISFRADERRFDVEGGYNIRYQMIKKRIDKVLIRGTKERLVQPGTIAVVVQDGNEVAMLMEDMQVVAEMGLLSQQIEELALEDLQGISGLYALRVKVNMS